jgi:phage shock protein C
VRRRYDAGVPLLRSNSNRMIGGVCGGLARWLGWDPTLVRVLYVLLSILSAAFPGTLVYIILWIVMPLSDD